MKSNRTWMWVGVLILAVVVAILIAVPIFIRARGDTSGRACINNLAIMDLNKEQAATEQTWGQLATQNQHSLPESATKR